MRNVFVEKWRSLVKFILLVSVVLSLIICWA